MARTRVIGPESIQAENRSVAPIRESLAIEGGGVGESGARRSSRSMGVTGIPFSAIRSADRSNAWSVSQDLESRPSRGVRTMGLAKVLGTIERRGRDQVVGTAGTDQEAHRPRKRDFDRSAGPRLRLPGLLVGRPQEPSNASQRPSEPGAGEPPDRHRTGDAAPTLARAGRADPRDRLHA